MFRPSKRICLSRDQIPQYEAVKTCEADQDQSDITLLKLPVDILFLIADHLEDEYLALLRLSCKSLSMVLPQRLDLKTCPPIAKQRFFRHFNFDYPQYLRCRWCGSSSLWQNAKDRFYTCECMYKWGPRYRRAHQTTIKAGIPSVPDLSHETVELILRAREYGADHGISLSQFNKTESVLAKYNSEVLPESGQTRSIKSQFVQGRLLVVIKWMINCRQEERGKAIAIVQRLLCNHQNPTISETLDPVVDIRLFNYKESRRARKVTYDNCTHCMSDFKQTVLKCENDRVQVEMDARIDFGTLDSMATESPQIFTPRRFVQNLRPFEQLSTSLHTLFDGYGVN